MWPPSLAKIPPVLRVILEQLIKQIDGNEPKDGTGNKVSDAAGGGKSINSFGQNTSQASAASERKPLQPYDASTDSTPQISVETGTFGQNAEDSAGDSTPTLGGVKIDTNPPPVLEVSDGDTKVYLHVSINTSSKITGITIETGATVPSPSTVSDYYVTLASIVVTTGDSASVKVGVPNLGGSQDFEQCGGADNTNWLI